jgi:hypothetical protein
MKINLKKLNILFIILTSIVIFDSASFANVSKNNDSPKYVISDDEKFNKIFREGRDLIDKEDWKKAAEKFNEIACDCPENKYVDAALYWLAFCYKKQKMFSQMDEKLGLLLRNYPSSSWADDARVMKYDRPAFSLVGIASRPTVTRNTPSETLATTFFATASQTPLDREDEIKLAAFQSLLSADPKRAIEIMGDMLRTGSKASETLKREVIRTLRSPRLYPGTLTYSGYYGYEVFGSKSNSQLLPQLRETLVKSYQNESNVKIQQELIYAIANLNDDQSANYLVQLYSTEGNKELRKAIINSFGGYGTSHYFYTGQNNNLVDAQSPVEVVASTTDSNKNTARKVYFEKLLEIVRTEKDVELRRLAFSNVQRFSGWSAKEGIIETLSQMYDSESDDDFKISIIRSFASSKQNQATTKLLNIAKSDKSDKMRLEAIRSLRTSKDPEVLKFLEDLIN